MTKYVWLLRTVRSSGVQTSGSQRSMFSGNEARCGTTPTIVYGSPFREIDRPIAAGSAPKRVRQTLSRNRTTRGEPGA